MELLIQVDYTSEQKGYLVHCVKNFETLEDSIIEMKNDKYATKGELNRQFDTLFSNFLYSFDSFVTFYTRSK